MKRVETGAVRAATCALMACGRGPPAGLWRRLVARRAAADVDAVVSQTHAAKSGDDFLPPEQAFSLSASADSPERVRLDWVIAPGYYLYRDRIKVERRGPDGRTSARRNFRKARSRTTSISASRSSITMSSSSRLPVKRSAGGGPLSLPLTVTYQGCAEAGLCYPPVTHTVSVQLPCDRRPRRRRWPGSGRERTGSRTARGYVSEQDRLAALLRSGSLAAVLLQFFVGGLLLAFTPCVLPMVPILSGLIVGQGKSVTTARAFSLSLTYVLGMAVTYTITGALFAAAGKQVQAVFQQPWIIMLFAALFIAMALSMFGLFTLQMPALHSDARRPVEQSPARRQLRRRRGHGHAVGADRHHLRRTGAGRGADRHRPDRRRAARRRGAVRHEPRHGRTAAGRRQFGRTLDAARRRLDGQRQAPVRRADAGAGGLDARAHRAGALDAAAVCRAGHRRGHRAVGFRADRACAPRHPGRRRPRRKPACARRQPGAVGGAQRGAAGGAVRAAHCCWARRAAARIRCIRWRADRAAADEPAFHQHQLAWPTCNGKCRPRPPRIRR